MPSSFLAQTTKTSAIGALEIQVLAPETRKPPSTVLARAVMLPGSEPESGSVSPKQPIASPLASRGSQVRFCASVP